MYERDNNKQVKMSGDVTKFKVTIEIVCDGRPKETIKEVKSIVQRRLNINFTEAKDIYPYLTSVEVVRVHEFLNGRLQRT